MLQHKSEKAGGGTERAGMTNWGPEPGDRMKALAVGAGMTARAKKGKKADWEAKHLAKHTDHASTWPVLVFVVYLAGKAFPCLVFHLDNFWFLATGQGRRYLLPVP